MKIFRKKKEAIEADGFFSTRKVQYPGGAAVNDHQQLPFRQRSPRVGIFDRGKLTGCFGHGPGDRVYQLLWGLLTN
jgi:hypothetical protein